MTPRNIRNAVITGPTGAVGAALCRVLLAHNVRVYAVCRPGSARVVNLPQDDRLIPVWCDISQLETLSEQIPGSVDVFYHFAWTHTIGPGRNDMPAQLSNVSNTICAVHAAGKLGCQVFIGAGSQAEYGRAEGILRPETPCFPETGYGMAKLCAGQMSRVECDKLGMAHIWPRILSVYGPYDGPLTMISSTIRHLLRGEKPALTEGVQNWDYLFSEDAAEAFYRMAVYGRSGAVYPLGSGVAHPLREYILTLRDAVDPSLPLGFGQIAYGPKQVMNLQADIRSLTADTGFSPATPFSEGIQKTITWMRHTDAE